MAARGVVPLLGDGASEVTLVHAADLARALVAAATSAATLGGTYHAGNAAPVTQRALAEELGRALGRPVRRIALPGPIVRHALGAAGFVARALGKAPLDKGQRVLAGLELLSAPSSDA
jgi:nucleoside-diphosphate-sugar epimerase